MAFTSRIPQMPKWYEKKHQHTSAITVFPCHKLHISLHQNKPVSRTQAHLATSCRGKPGNHHYKYNCTLKTPVIVTGTRSGGRTAPVLRVAVGLCRSRGRPWTGRPARRDSAARGLPLLADEGPQRVVRHQHQRGQWFIGHRTGGALLQPGRDGGPLVTVAV